MRELIVSTADIAELSQVILQKNRSFSCKVHGNSMIPFIFNGDVITFRKFDISKISVYDVVIFESSKGGLTVHRIVSKRNDTFMIRGDSNCQYTQMINADSIIGRLSQIKRRDKIIRINEGIYHFMGYIWVKMYPVNIVLLRIYDFFVKAAAYLLNKLRNIKFCRYLIKRIFSVKPEYSIMQSNDIEQVSRHLGYCSDNSSEKTLSKFIEDSDNYEGNHLIIAKVNGEICASGFIFLKISPLDDKKRWYVSSLRVRKIYKGLGIGYGMMKYIEELALSRGIYNLFLSVSERNRVAVSLYEKLNYDKPKTNHYSDIFLESGNVFLEKHLEFSKTI